MSNDWLYDDDRRNFSVVGYYTELEWVRMLRGPIQTTERTMISIYDLFPAVGTENKKIFIQGKEVVWIKRCSPS